MKIRDDFVTNSSSSSFIIKLCDITAKQLYQITNHVDYANMKGWDFYYDCPWSIRVNEDQDTIEGDTFMDNFDMREFFEKIGVDPNIAEWKD